LLIEKATEANAKLDVGLQIRITDLGVEISTVLARVYLLNGIRTLALCAEISRNNSFPSSA
jgi:hypothetical protein